MVGNAQIEAGSLMLLTRAQRNIHRFGCAQDIMLEYHLFC